MPGYTRMMAAKVEAALRGWHHGQVVDMSADTAKLTSQIALGALFPSTTPHSLLDSMHTTT
jgi:hypothetical protein